MEEIIKNINEKILEWSKKSGNDPYYEGAIMGALEAKMAVIRFMQAGFIQIVNDINDSE